MIERVDRPARAWAVCGIVALLVAACGIAPAVAAGAAPGVAEAVGQEAGRPVPHRNAGPEAWAHSRVRRGRHGTTRIIRRTPAVMREDAARMKRGDLFSTWSTAASQ